MQNEAADAVIIGAGVIGCAVALELAGRGWRTVSVDTLPTAGYGSTSSSSAVVRLNYSTRAGVAMAWEGLQYWRDWSNHVQRAAAPHTEFVSVDMVMLKSPGGHHERVVPLFDAVGVPYDDLDVRELTARFPSLDPRRFGPPVPLTDEGSAFWGEPEATFDGAIVMPDSGYVTDPQLAAQNLCDAAKAEGAKFRFGSEVVSITVRDARVIGVTLADGSNVESPVVVNVAGPHASNINRLAGAVGGVQSRPLRREVYVVPAPAGVDFEADGFMCGDLDTGVYFRPERGNNLLIGSAEPECDGLEWVDDPDTFRQTLTEDDYLVHVLRTARRVRNLGVPTTKRGLAALYDASPDWTPIYDRTDVAGFYQAIGSSGNQFKNAAVAGHCMAELITAVEGGHDHDRDPLTVTGRYTGAAIDLATFSRNRLIDDDSPSTVLG